MEPRKGLGRGLSALLADVAPAEDAPRRVAVPEASIPIERIRPNPNQPRVQFREETIDELADSIQERGVLQPILLRPAGDGFEIVAGERRWRAAQKARLHAIPAIVRDIDEASMAELALIENIQREDLNAIEEAEGYRQLIERHGHTQDGVSKLARMSSTVGQITTSVKTLSELVEEVSEATRQQANGLEQVRQSVVQLEHVTQTTAATAEESAADLAARSAAARDGIEPGGWVLWRLVPDRVEFWQGSSDRRHLRTIYRRTAEGWQLTEPANESENQ